MLACLSVCVLCPRQGKLPSRATKGRKTSAGCLLRCGYNWVGWCVCVCGVGGLAHVVGYSQHCSM